MNRRREAVGYQPLRLRPLLSEGLLPVSREGGDLERRVAEGLFHMAGYFGDKANAETARANYDAANRDLQAGITNASMDYEHGIDPAIAGSIPAQRGPVADVLRNAAKKYGQDGETLVAIAQIESRLNPNAKNPNSNASGVLQFMPDTARGYGLANPFDLNSSADAGARLLKDNRNYLTKTLGREPTAGELYLAHQQGAGGALKLLSNPNRRASDIVGYDAVKLNGGTASMTAGEFATLWTRKVKPGKAPDSAPASASYVGQVNGDGSISTATESTAPDSAITTGVTASNVAPVTPHMMAMPALSHSDTVGGRAYNKAMVAGYLNQVEAEVGTTTAAVYRKFKDDPQGMAQGFEALRREFLKNHIMPEIAADFEAAYVRKTGAFIDEAYAQQDQRAKDNAKADFITRTGDLETTQQQTLAGFDASSGNTAAIIADQQGAIDRHYDEAASRGLISPEEAANKKISSRREAAAGFYSKQAEGLDAQDIETMRQNMQADFADGGIDGLDGQGWVAVNIGLQKLVKDRLTEDAATARDLRKRGDDMAERLLMGFDIPQGDLAQLTFDSGAGAAVAAEMKVTDQKIAIGRAIRDLPLPDAQARLEEMRKGMGTSPSDETIKLYEFGQKMLDKKVDAVTKTPLTYAEQQGLTKESPIDTSTPDTLSASLNARRAAVEQAATMMHAPVPLFKPEEVAVIKGSLQTSDPARHANNMAQLDFMAGQTSLKDVSDTFGDAAVTKLQDWQGRLRYSSPEEAKAWLKERADPQWQERIKPLVTEGEKEARKIKFEEVVSGLNSNRVWGANEPVDADIKRALMNDFVALVGDRYAATGDMGTAKEQALERMKKLWGTSTIDGSYRGRVMAYPPENHLPMVAGSKDWITAEFADLAKAQGVDPAQLSLVADGKTKVAADKGEAPGYLVSKVNPETGLDEMVVDGNGHPMRYFFDPAAAEAKALAAAKEARRTQNDPWYVMTSGTSIGPWYGPFHPATAVDMKQRELRIKEILAERRIMGWDVVVDRATLELLLGGAM